MKTGIIILNYNNYSDTINCIKTIYENCLNTNYSILVVDNCSTDDSIEHIKKFFEQSRRMYKILNECEVKTNFDIPLILIKTNYNRGYAAGNNIGIKFFINKKTDYILILNSDVLLKSDIISVLVNKLKKNEEIGIIGPLLKTNDNSIDYNCCRTKPSNKLLLMESLDFIFGAFRVFKKEINKKYLLMNKPSLLKKDLVFCDIISGSCMLAKTATWEILEGFDENTFLYYEENILYEKLKKHNFKTALVPSASAIHLGAKTTKKVNNIHLLRIALDSVKYYLNTYSEINFLLYILIVNSRMLQIFLIKCKNKLPFAHK